MRIGLYFNHDLDLLTSELYAQLVVAGHKLEVNENCLCGSDKIEGLDALIFHPEYDNSRECWSRLRALIEKNLAVDFYMFAVNADERQDFFGKMPNLYYIAESKFFFDPSKYIEENRARRENGKPRN